MTILTTDVALVSIGDCTDCTALVSIVECTVVNSSLVDSHTVPSTPTPGLTLPTLTCNPCDNYLADTDLDTSNANVTSPSLLSTGVPLTSLCILHQYIDSYVL